MELTLKTRILVTPKPGTSMNQNTDYEGLEHNVEGYLPVFMFPFMRCTNRQNILAAVFLKKEVVLNVEAVSRGEGKPNRELLSRLMDHTNYFVASMDLPNDEDRTVHEAAKAFVGYPLKRSEEESLLNKFIPEVIIGKLLGRSHR